MDGAAASQRRDAAPGKQQKKVKKSSTTPGRTSQTEKPRANAKGKQRAQATGGEPELDLHAEEAAKDSTTQAVEQWPFIKLSDPVDVQTLPPVFTPDGKYCMLASGPRIRIYDIEARQLVSTLQPSLSTTSSSQAEPLNDSVPSTSSSNIEAVDHEIASTITGLFLHPSNALQLVSTNLTGSICIWDYLDGELLRTINIKSSITCAAVSSAHPDCIFVAAKLRRAEGKGANNDGGSGDVAEVGKSQQESRKKAKDSHEQTNVLRISLTREKNTTKPKIANLGTIRNGRKMAISADGRYLITASFTQMLIVTLDAAGQEQSLPADERTPPVLIEAFAPRTFLSITSLAVHPRENYFVTGNSKGHINFWYLLTDDMLREIRNNLASGQLQHPYNAVPATHISRVHWHAHAVDALTFTPNGAYMLSGGEEAVIVMWHMATAGGMHKEFVPRLGAPLASISAVSLPERQQEMVARLSDGSFVFVGAATMQVSTTIADIKALPPQTQSMHSAGRMPFVVEPRTRRLVFPGSHPSSLQFLSPAATSSVTEVEIAPTNRVSRKDARLIEPIRVEKVTFCPEPLSRSQAEQIFDERDNWMFTFDTWQDRSYQQECRLKIWRQRSVSGGPSQSAYVLNTRLDRPHGRQRLTALASSRVSLSDGSRPQAVLASTSADGTIKIWAHRVTDAQQYPEGQWYCRLSFDYRGYPALDATFSEDGSLLAVCHPQCVTLWSTVSGGLIATMASSASPSKTGKVAFVGSRLAILRRSALSIWDIISCQELLATQVEQAYDMLPLSRDGDVLVVVTRSREVTIVNVATLATHTILAPLRTQAVASLPLGSLGGQDIVADGLAGISEHGEVFLMASTAESLVSLTTANEVGSEVVPTTAAAPIPIRAGGSRPLTAATQPVGLFDEILGFDKAQTSQTSINSLYEQSTVDVAVLDGDRVHSEDVFASAAPHNLPPLSSLWRGLLQSRLKPLASASAQSHSVNGAAGVVVKEEEGEDDEYPGHEEEDEQEAGSEDAKRGRPSGLNRMARPGSAKSLAFYGDSNFVTVPIDFAELFKDNLKIAQQEERSSTVPNGVHHDDEQQQQDSTSAGNDQRASLSVSPAKKLVNGTAHSAEPTPDAADDVSMLDVSMSSSNATPSRDRNKKKEKKRRRSTAGEAS